MGMNSTSSWRNAILTCQNKHKIVFFVRKYISFKIHLFKAYALSAMAVVIFLEFYSTKRGLPLVNSWSHGLH